MTHYLLLFVAAVFVNNVVLSQFLGICPFLGVSKKVDTAIGMGAAVTFVLALSTMCTFLLQKFVLEPFDMVYMQTISFILVIAALVQMVEIILKKVSPALYQALGVFLPLITTNCCVLGVAILGLLVMTVGVGVTGVGGPLGDLGDLRVAHPGLSQGVLEGLGSGGEGVELEGQRGGQADSQCLAHLGADESLG